MGAMGNAAGTAGGGATAGAITATGTGVLRGNNLRTMADKPKATNPVNAMVSGEERLRGDNNMVKQARTTSTRFVVTISLGRGNCGNLHRLE